MWVENAVFTWGGGALNALPTADRVKVFISLSFNLYKSSTQVSSFPLTIIYFYMVNLFDVRVKIVTKLNHSQNYPSQPNDESAFEFHCKENQERL